MTAKLSPQKASRIMRHYFGGMSQTSIARKLSVDQSTVSIYVSRFKERASEIGLLAAGKELDVFQEVDNLRSLSVELLNARLTVEEAKQGWQIVRAFTRLGVDPQKHTALVSVCRSIERSDFVEAAIKLADIEARTDMACEEIVSEIEEMKLQLPELEKQLRETHDEVADVNNSLAHKKKQLADLKAQFDRRLEKIRAEQARIEQALADKMAQLSLKERELEAIARLKDDLCKKGLDIPTLIALANEFDCGSTDKEHTKLREAIERFDTLEDAIAVQQSTRTALEKENSELGKRVVELKRTEYGLSDKVRSLSSVLNDHKGQVQLLSEKIRQYGRQYELFEGFLAMVAGSPSTMDPVEALIASLQKLLDPGWYVSKDVDELRSIFVRIVMGDYLKCFRCEACGAKFVVNSEPAWRYFKPSYVCPACHLSYQLKADDSLLKAMVSEEQLQNTRRIEEVLNENKTLLSLKPFLDIPCEICGKPITKWTEENAQKAIEGVGWAHDQCWNSNAGQMRQLRKAISETRRKS